MPVMAVSKFERFFRLAASLDIDKADIKRYSDFVHQKIYDLLLMGVATAKANDRDTVEPWDLPITKGLQENIHAFRKLDEVIRALEGASNSMIRVDEGSREDLEHVRDHFREQVAPDDGEQRRTGEPGATGAG